MQILSVPLSLLGTKIFNFEMKKYKVRDTQNESGMK